MNTNNKFQALIAITLLLFITHAKADHTYQWQIQARDSKTSTPISGVEFNFTFIDPNANKKQTQDKCITDSNGNCSVTATVSSSIFSGSEVWPDYSINKDGYSKIHTITKKATDYKNHIWTVKLSAVPSQENNTSSIQNWGHKDGPTISSHTSKQPHPIAELFRDGAENSAIRGKFETEEEYLRKLAATSTEIVIPSNQTSIGKLCTTTYDHKTGIYSIQKCTMFLDNIPLAISKEIGQPLVLSNAYDSRQIKRYITNKYSIINSPGFVWSADFKVTPQEAKELDSDIIPAVEIEGYRLVNTCSICDSRQATDNIEEITETLGKITGKSTKRSDGWKNDAFKFGEIEEFWNHILIPKKINRFFIYKKSDNRIMFEIKVD